MGIIGGELGYRLLRTFWPNEPSTMSGAAYAGRSKVETLFGATVWEEIRGRTVIEFGCGSGAEAIELAQRGACQVYGVDILERWLQIARERAGQANCTNVTFSQSLPAEPVDIIVCIDTFEHVADPAAILETMAGILRPGGRVLACFGPTWYHPLGGHLFSVFPWAHLVFTEKALCRWRSHLRSDGARKFGEVEGGLNQLTIARFERIVKGSRFQIEDLSAVPIRGTRRFHNRGTREFLTSLVRCRLSLKEVTARPLPKSFAS